MRSSRHHQTDATHAREEFRPRRQQLERRDVPTASILPLNNFANRGMTLRGFENGAFSGLTVAGAGDVNGAVVGVPYTGALGTDRGAAYVAFCGPTRAVVIITLNALALGGLTPVGFENSAADYSVSGSGRRLRDASRTFRNRARSAGPGGLR